MLITKHTGLIVFALIDEFSGLPANEISALIEVEPGSVQAALNHLLEQEIVKQKGRKLFYCS